MISNVSSEELSPLDKIMNFGYKGQSYVVQTTDGYMLTIFRIYSNSSNGVKKPPCLLMHGNLESSLQFLQLERDSLPFILSNHGYDVFLGNSRCNQFSSHIDLSKTSHEYWNYTLHELGFYDLSATIDVVLNVTESEKLFYTGISQGASIAMILLSTKPEYNRKIIQLHLMGPGVYIGNPPNYVAFNMATFFLDNYQHHGIFGISRLFDSIKPFEEFDILKNNVMFLCRITQNMIPDLNICNHLIEIENTKQLLKVSSHQECIKKLTHFKQLINTNRFQMFDYGEENTRIYGRSSPPEYDLKSVAVPTFIYYGENDGLLKLEVRDE